MGGLIHAGRRRTSRAQQGWTMRERDERRTLDGKVPGRSPTAHMTERGPRYGLSLPNRGILFGATSVDELIEVAEQAESSGAFDSIWVGDSLFIKPRLE